ncbi:MAG: hypothetical protein K2H35_02120 [Muribaculaceae bacterium]|nr:hypothetical protein [Muribaculaceae bacterium]
MNRYLPLVLPCALIFAAGSCKKYNPAKAQSQREEWIASLHDSIAQINKMRAEDSARIISLRQDIDNNIKEFSQVANQREVAPYYILSSAKGEYPLTATGIIARVTNDMQFEVIAALSGQKFDAIRLAAGGDASRSVTSTVVPPDQALNYTSADGLTVVAFSGALNAPLGEFAADNSIGHINVEYMMNGAVRKSVSLAPARRNCIARTWQFTSSRAMLDSLEAFQVINARKLEILHITLKQHEGNKKQ